MNNSRLFSIYEVIDGSFVLGGDNGDLIKYLCWVTQVEQLIFLSSLKEP